MNSKLKLLCGLLATTPVLISCSDSDGFSSGGTETGTTPTAQHLSLGASETPASVLTGTAPDTTWEINHPVDITVVVGDNNNLKVNGGTVYFEADYGLFSAKSCELVNGECSVTWYSEEFLDAPVDLFVAITAWTMGEEGYYDLNDSGNFDDGDILASDTAEPFIDIDHSGAYNAGDVIIDVDNNGSHTAADGLYNGAGCTHSTLCNNSITRIPIYTIMYLNMDDSS